MLSNWHSRCLDCNFGTKIVYGRNIVRFCCPTLIEKLLTEFPKLHYMSPDERFEESSPSVQHVDGKVFWLKSL